MDHESCVPYEGEGLEVGLLSDKPTPGNSGIFWVSTVENEDDACYFTTMDIADGAKDAMIAGWSDLWKIDLVGYVKGLVG